MFLARIRFLIGIAIIILGALIHSNVGFSSAWYMYLAGIIILATHFLFGNVMLAFGKLNKGEVDAAEDLILQIKRPNFLLKTHQAYYYFVLGMVALQKKQTGFGEQHLKQALIIGLKSDTDNALVAINIAHVHFVKKEYKLANEYRLKAETYNSNDLMIKENLKKLSEALQKCL
jgi:hypothetical protein